MLNSRSDEIIELRKSGRTYAEIGRRFGMSRERIRQILKGKPTREKTDLGTNQMLRVSEVASLLGLHANTVRRWESKGVLKAHWFGGRGDRRFRREDIDNFLKPEKAIKSLDTSE